MKSFARAIAAFGLGSIAGTAMQVARGKLAALFLGTAGVGVLNLLGSTWTLLSTVSGLGVSSGIIKRIATAKEHGDAAAISRQVSSALFFLGSISLLVTVAVALLASPISDFLFHDNGQRQLLVIIVALGVPFTVGAQVYRAILSAGQKTKAIVSAQLLSDILGLVAFTVLIYHLDITGAIVAVSLLHLFKLVLLFVWTTHYSGIEISVPRFSQFNWSEVQYNVGFGANGLLLVAVGIVSVMLVSRWVIASLGLDAQGVFSTAWKVASVYLAAIYASAGSHYFPALAACDTDSRLHTQIDESLSAYMYSVPPVIAAIALCGEWLMIILFNRDFVPAAGLLLLLLPGDYFRIAGETAGLPLLARRRLFLYASIYITWASSYLLFTLLLLPRLGLTGVALAYLVSQALQCAITLVVVRRVLTYSMSRQTTVIVLRGGALIFLAALIAWKAPNVLTRLLLGLPLGLVWLRLSWTDHQFRELATGFLRKLRVLPA